MTVVRIKTDGTWSSIVESMAQVLWALAAAVATLASPRLSIEV